MVYPGARSQELAGKPVGVEWVQDPGAGPAINLHIGSPDIAAFSGEFTNEDMPNAIRWRSLRVHPDYRGGGSATRLVSALAHMAIRYDTTTMYGFVESQHTLRIFRRIAGDAAISYTSPDPVTREAVASTDQAIRALERAEAYETDLEDRDLGMSVVVYLTGVDSTILERPVDLVLLIAKWAFCQNLLRLFKCMASLSVHRYSHLFLDYKSFAFFSEVEIPDRGVT